MFNEQIVYPIYAPSQPRSPIASQGDKPLPAAQSTAPVAREALPWDILLDIVRCADFPALKLLAQVNRDLELVTRPLLWKSYSIRNDVSEDAFTMLNFHLDNMRSRNKSQYIEHIDVILKHDFLPPVPVDKDRIADLEVTHSVLDELRMTILSLPKLCTLRLELDGPEIYRNIAASKILQNLSLANLRRVTTNLSVDGIPHSLWEGCPNITTLDFASSGITRRIRSWNAPPPASIPLQNLVSLDIVDTQSAHVARGKRLCHLRVWSLQSVGMETFLNYIETSLSTLEELGMHIPHHTVSNTPFYETLLPHLTNLRVLHLRTYPVGDAWLEEAARTERISIITAVGSLPLLHELVVDMERMEMVSLFETFCIQQRRRGSLLANELESDEDGEPVGLFPHLLRAEIKYWNSPIPWAYTHPRHSVFTRTNITSEWVKLDREGFGDSRWPSYGKRSESW